ncbi:MAG: FGGY-family carbohydrate kinase [Actinomycetota bacterium]
MASLGSGAIQPGATTATIGTSGAVRTVTREPATDPHGRLFCYVLAEDRWVVGGPVSNGGLVLQWVRDLLAQEELASSGNDASYQVLLEEAGRIEPGAGGVLFLPYLVGERAPHWNAEATGVLMGLRLNHDRAHIVRAALEGVVYGLRSIATLVEELVPLHGPVRATGGFSRSKLWLQMLADVLGREVEVPAQQDASPLGAAVLGLMAVGAIDSIDAVDDMVEISSRASPDPSASQTYDEMFERFVALYDDLEGGFERMARRNK